MTKPLHAPTPQKPAGKINDYKIPFPFVEVIWDDASSNSESWVAIKDIAAPEQVITRGWLVREEESFVCIAASISNEDLQEDVVGNTMTVPRGMIVAMRELTVSTKRPKKPKAESDAKAE